MINDYLTQPSYHSYRIYGVFEDHDFDLYVCYPLAIVLNYTFDYQDDYSSIRKITKETLDNFTLSQLATKSLSPEDLIDSIYYNYKPELNQFNINRPIDYAFLNSNYTNQQIYSKCFGYRIPKLNEPSYRRILQASKLVIKSKILPFNIFLTEQFRTLNLKSVQLNSNHSVQKNIDEITVDKFQCLNYDQNPNLNCDSSNDCINNCIIDEFTRAFNKTPAVVFNGKTYSKYKDYNFGLDHMTKFSKFEKKCEKNYSKIDCFSVEFKPEPNEIPTPFIDKKWEIFIYFSTRFRKLDLETDLLTVSVNMVSMYVILVGFSFPVFCKLIALIFAEFLRKRVLYFEIIFKYLSIFKKLVTFILFIFYLQLVLTDLLTNMTYSSYMDDNLSGLNFPAIGICFKMNETILNYSNNRTGYELEEMTKQISKEKILLKIYYINSKSEEIDWTLNKSFDTNFKIDHIYYEDKKCFEFNYTLNVKDIRLNNLNHGLRIDLQKNLSFNHYYYYSKINGDNVPTFNRFFKLDVANHYNINFDRSKLFFHDLYQSFKNPLHWFVKADRIRDPLYLIELKKNFESSKNSTTLHLPLKKESFNLKIRNDLFDQYVEEEVNPKERFVVDYNFEGFILRDYISDTFSKNYSLSFSKRIYSNFLKIESSYNYVTFFLNLLNLITFWFDLSLIECLNRSVQTILNFEYFRFRKIKFFRICR